jgi:polyphenol oxidase
MSRETGGTQDPATGAAPSRRDFLTRAGALAGGMLVAGAPQAHAARGRRTKGGPTMEEVIAMGKGASAYPPVVRSDVTTFTEGSTQLTNLKNGVQTMRGRTSGPLSWTGQADIHRIWCNSPPVPNTYVHNSWRFLVWHRAYLYFNEQILQAAAGTTSLTLPYWNWTVNLALPAQYYGTGNPLNDPTRRLGPTGRLDPAETAIARLLSLTDFPSFGGTATAAGGLEVGPHNYVHRTVGGNMGAFATAGLDPIFWAHHCNVDRVWYTWLGLGGTRMNPVDPAWLTQSYPFYDTSGNSFNISFADAASLPVRYNAPPRVFSIAGQRVRLQGPQTVRVRVPADIALSAPAPAEPPPVLHVTGISIPTDEAVTVHVFANREGATAATSTSDRSFAGSFTLIPTGHPHEGVELRIPLHNQVPQMLKANVAAGASNLALTLVPVGGRTFEYGGLELEVR